MVAQRRRQLACKPGALLVDRDEPAAPWRLGLGQLEFQQMLNDSLDVALDGLPLAPAQVLHLLDQVLEIEFFKAPGAKQRSLALSPERKVLLVKIAGGRWCDDLGHVCVPQWATAAAPCSSTRRPLEKRSRANGAAIGCGSPLATVCANT